MQGGADWAPRNVRFACLTPELFPGGDDELLVDLEMGAFEVVKAHDFFEVRFMMLHDFP